MFFGFMNNDDIKKSYAYTLAEMLIVLVIISVVLISLPIATKKLFSVKEVKTYHGRYECYWDDDGNLKYYYAKERKGLAPIVEEGTAAGDYCEFKPPLTYPYMIFHAVGGGGAGGNLTDTVPTPEIVSTYIEYPSDSSKRDNWFNRLLEGIDEAGVSNNFGIRSKNLFVTLLTSRQVPLKYRKSGNAGSLVSMFFPYVPTGKTFHLIPGKGGELDAQNKNGKDGNPSIVQVIEGNEECDITDENASCNIIWARGGSGAAVLGTDNNVIDLSSNILLLGGKLSDYGISNYADVKSRESGFSDIIDKFNKMGNANITSKIPSDAGNGGNGANQYVKDKVDGFYFHEFDNYTGREARKVGVNWTPVSNYYINNVKNVYSQNCEVKNAGIAAAAGFPTEGFWIERSESNVTTQCTPYFSSYYTCAVGNMKRDVSDKLCSQICNPESSGQCACYTFNYSGTLVSSSSSYYHYNNLNKTPNELLQIYKDPTFDISTKTMTIKEHIPDASYYISCTAEEGFENGATPCKNNSEFDSTKGICKAKKGGDGAIVVLW